MMVIWFTSLVLLDKNVSEKKEKKWMIDTVSNDNTDDVVTDNCKNNEKNTNI